MNYHFTNSSLALPKKMVWRSVSASRTALLCRFLLFALYSNAPQHLSPEYAYDAKMICTTLEFAETSPISLLRDGSHVLNMTVYDRDCEVVLKANSRKLNQRCSKGVLTCVWYSLEQPEDERQDSPDGTSFVGRIKRKQNLLKGDALYELKSKRTLRISTTIGASGEEEAILRHAENDEDSISLRDGKSNVPFFSILCRKFWPVAMDDLVEPSICGAMISNLSMNDYHDFETPSLEVAEGSNRTSEYLLICKSCEGLSGDDNLSYLRRDPLNHTSIAKVIALVDHVRRNIQFEGLSSLQHGRHSPPGRRRLFAVTPVTAPVAAPAEAPVVSPPSPDETAVVAAPTPMAILSPPPVILSPPPPKAVLSPPPVMLSPPPPVVMLSPPPVMPSPPPPMGMLSPPPVMLSPPPPVVMLSPPPVMLSPPPPMVMLSPPPVMLSPPPPMVMLSPPPVMLSPPPPMVMLSPPLVVASAPAPMIMLSPPPAMPSPPPPLKAYAPFPPPPPPIASFDFVPPDEMQLLQTTITGPDSYNINNVSVYTTGVDIAFVNVSPSSILLLEFASSMRVYPVKLPALHNEKKSSEGLRRLFQVPTPTPAPGPAPVADWYPLTQGISEGLTITLQVDAGSLLVLLPGYLANFLYASRQATVNGPWLPMTQSSEPWVWVPGPGIQFLGSIDEINDALLTLEFGVTIGTGKARTCTLTVMAAHLFENLTTIAQSLSVKKIKLNVAGASTWFVILQYTKTFYKNSLGILCFFALVLVILCCILGCCMCHDAKMEKIFQKNRTVLKEQDAALKENMVFNPVWIPSAPVIPGRKKFVVVHNPKFLQQRLADHLSSLHGALVKKVVSNRDFDKQLEGEEDMQDLSKMVPFSSHISTGFSEPEGMSHGLASETTPGDSSDDEGESQSTHYTIKDDRQPGSPLSPGGFSKGSDSTHYDIGSFTGGDSD